MNRRTFVGTIGATSLFQVHGKGQSAESRPDQTSQSRSRIDLNGAWERRVNGTVVDTVQVPSSLRPAGFYSLRRDFPLPKLRAGQRAILHFDAITYYGRARVNGTELGAMYPYVPFEFDATAAVREGSNTIEVEIADLVPGPSGAGKTEITLGVNPGWEAYGGIIRDVFLELRPAVFIDNVRFGYRLDQRLSRAECRAEIQVSTLNSDNVDAELSIFDGDRRIAGATGSATASLGISEVALTFVLDNPGLWSPEHPRLYSLQVTLRSKGGTDSWKCRTGFRSLETRGGEFLLNGERLVLNGLCRHDMWKDQGFTLTRSQMEQDMRMIKGLGSNFVRLVHYPHHRYIVDLADELGILVTEEPGYWQADFSTMPREMIQLGLNILERAIRRDWNSPSVFGWLLANESRVTANYLREGKALCRKLDPLDRLVSSANDKADAQMKPIFEESGMDFFDQHPYTMDFDEFEKIADFYGSSKPLIFSEWGGRAVAQSEVAMPETVNRLVDLVHRKKLAGHAYWSWQDLPQFTRIDAEMRDGILESGVVTETRQRREIVFTELARLYEQWRQPAHVERDGLQVIPLNSPPWAPGSSLQPLNLQALVDSPEGKQAWAQFEKLLAAFWSEAPETAMGRDQWKRTGSKFDLWPSRRLRLSGAGFDIAAVDGFARPLALLPGTSFRLPVNQSCKRLHFLGNVTAPTGFPVGANSGELAARFTIEFSGGKVQGIPLRQGVEATRANLIYAATRIQPVATQAQRALTFIKDPAREHYQVLLFSVPAEGNIQSIVFEGAGNDALLLFAVIAQTD